MHEDAAVLLMLLRQQAGLPAKGNPSEAGCAKAKAAGARSGRAVTAWRLMLLRQQAALPARQQPCHADVDEELQDTCTSCPVPPRSGA
jgi:hypothetical protein